MNFHGLERDVCFNCLINLISDLSLIKTMEILLNILNLSHLTSVSNETANLHKTNSNHISIILMLNNWNICSIPFIFHNFFSRCGLGYGNISPNNTFGRIFMIFYALVGIPVNGILFAYLGDFFGKTVSITFYLHKNHIGEREKKTWEYKIK